MTLFSSLNANVRVECHNPYNRYSWTKNLSTSASPDSHIVPQYLVRAGTGTWSRKTIELQWNCYNFIKRRENSEFYSHSLQRIQRRKKTEDTKERAT